MEQATLDELHSQWCNLTRAFSPDEGAINAIFLEITAHYRQEGRYYHTLEHVVHVLETANNLYAGYNGQDFDAILLAGWLHDVIYDTRANDNEERSAEYAGGALARLHVPDEKVAIVKRLILATKVHQTAVSDAAGHILLDADLAILGVDEVDYDTYAAAIRKEYAWVTEEAYRTGRGQVLQRFLQRPRLYFTAPMFDAYETQARANLMREITRLSQNIQAL